MLHIRLALLGFCSCAVVTAQTVETGSWRVLAAAPLDTAVRFRDIVEAGDGAIALASGEWLAISRGTGGQQLFVFMRGACQVELSRPDDGERLRLTSGAISIRSTIATGAAPVRLALADESAESRMFTIPAGQIFAQGGASAGIGFIPAYPSEQWQPTGAEGFAPNRWLSLANGAFTGAGDLQSVFIGPNQLDQRMLVETAASAVQRRRTILQAELVQTLSQWDETTQVASVVPRITENRELRVLSSAAATQVNSATNESEAGAGLSSQAGAFGLVRFPGSQSPAEISRQRAANDRNRRVDFNFGGQGLGTNGYGLLGVPAIDSSGRVNVGPGALATPR